MPALSTQSDPEAMTVSEENPPEVGATGGKPTGEEEGGGFVVSLDGKHRPPSKPKPASVGSSSDKVRKPKSQQPNSSTLKKAVETSKNQFRKIMPPEGKTPFRN